MDILLSISAFLLAILGIAGCIVRLSPEPLLSYGGLLCAYFTSYSQMGPAALWVWLAVCIVVSVADYFLPAWMTKRFGGSRAGSIGATVGVFVGFFFLPPIGIILGPSSVPSSGRLLHDRNDRAKALVVGIGSFLVHRRNRHQSSSPRSGSSSTSQPIPGPHSATGSQPFSKK